MNLDVLTPESYHIRIGKERVTVRSLDTGKHLTCRSAFHIDEEGEVAGIHVVSSSDGLAGQEPSAAPAETIDPFGHPRVVMDQYRYAEKLVRYLMDRVRTSWWSSAHTLFVQLTYDPEGGISEVEKRALRDSMEHAGGRVIHLVNPAASASNEDIDHAYDVLNNEGSMQEDPRVQKLFRTETERS